ncbi:MAG: hypothetical protein JO348_03925 [Alphaproteobacteria bacterium]|nr:hypothetical protein [Alphaproteobacteria bacterium]MBV9418898.1 hypothetical protein [Alphaproteobacteria bacterium]MBV9540538.1 hypothetical protein [Alphaproteobacteria bacterium]MBV9904493.1 hypothetical protein [Alphaproteobacteria bacterium]
MKKGALVRAEIYVGIVVFAMMLALAGYGLIAALSDKLDPKVRACIDRAQTGQGMSRDDAVGLCKHLEAVGGL